MRSLYFTCFILTFTAYAQSQTAMFRGTPQHTSSITSQNNFVFGDEVWKFNADAPIRSTAVCNSSTVFFGTSKGTFYALDKINGSIKWQFNTGFSIASSPALLDNNVFFSDNKQSLYSLNATTGKLNWKIDFNKSLSYDWGFDYYYSSPTIIDNKILIGSKDGFVYDLNATNGKIIWKFKTEGIVL